MSDLRIVPVGGGSHDLELVTTDGVDDFVLVGDDEATHPDAVAQEITYIVGMWLGESAFDRALGFPWEQAVFGKQPAEAIVVFLYDQIIAAEGVSAFVEPPVIEIDNAARRAIITAKVQGVDFVIDLQQIVQEP